MVLAAPPTYSLRHLGVVYPGQTPALQGVSAELHHGQSVALVGPNGSGKSTLLRALFGAVAPTSGQVCWRGNSLGSIPRRELAKRVAHVPSSLALPFTTSAAQVVMMGRIPHLGAWGGESACDWEVARECLNAMDTLHLAGRPFNACSAGEQQRILLAKALAQQPEVLLLDEPSAHLDLKHTADLLARLCVLQRSGVAIVLATHDLDSVSRVCERAWLLQRGRLVAAGLLADVFTAPLLSEVYGVALRVYHDAHSGRIRVITQH